MNKRFRMLINRAGLSGAVRVIVGLLTSFQPEGRLNLLAARSQRRAIAQAQDVLLARLSSFKIRDVRKYETIPFIAMEADAAALSHMAASGEVASVEEDTLYFPTLAESGTLIGAAKAWASGYAGGGQEIAVLDSGVDKTHPFLAGKVVSEACYSTDAPSSSIFSLCPGRALSSTSPGSGINCDASIFGCEHGTHVAGIAAGRGSTFSGVARNANIISIQVYSRMDDPSKCPNGFTSCLTGYASDLVSGLLRVQALIGTHQIAAVNLSLGGVTKYTSACDSDNLAITSAINTLKSLGIATIVAAGDNGYVNGLTAPACVSKAISVGSTGDGSSGDGCPFGPQDQVSDFSNSASYLSLLAPGQCIRSSVPGGGYMNLSGTSMAAPHVAGAWAILKSKFPSAGVDQILSALTSTGVPITDSRNNVVTQRIQVDAALDGLVGGNNVLRYGSGDVVTLSANANAGYAFVKWQQDGADFSTISTISVQADAGASHTLTAVFRQSSTMITSVTVTSPKLIVINGSGFGSSPRVLIDGADKGNYINSASDTTITMKGKLKKMGLKAGTHNVQVVGGAGDYSNIFTVTIL